jgi:tRNA 5-methylaminomethyl-2-thiouridine biosynthesis bifunctional protein
MNSVLCGDGYVAETASNKLCFGASFMLAQTRMEASSGETLGNLEKLRKLSSQLHDCVMQLTPDKLTNRVSIRTSTPDYLPIVGPVAIAGQITADFQHLKKDSNYRFSCKGSYYRGLYVNVGHGSKGLATTPIAAEIITDYIFNAPFALESDSVEALHPARFLIRTLIKNR